MKRHEMDFITDNDEHCGRVTVTCSDDIEPLVAFECLWAADEMLLYRQDGELYFAELIYDDDDDGSVHSMNHNHRLSESRCKVADETEDVDFYEGLLKAYDKSAFFDWYQTGRASGYFNVAKVRLV